MIGESLVCKIKFHMLHFLLPALILLMGIALIGYSRYLVYIGNQISLQPPTNVQEAPKGLIERTWNKFTSLFTNLEKEEIKIKQEKFTKAKIALIFGILLCLPLMISIWNFCFKKALLTDKRVYVRQGLVLKKMDDLLIGKIAMITVKQSLFQKIFSIGHLYLYASAGNPIKLKNVCNPFVIKRYIEDSYCKSNAA